MSDRPNGPTSSEMTEFENDDVSLLDKVVHPFDYKGVVKTHAWVTLDRSICVQCPSVAKLRRDFPAIAMFCTGTFKYLSSSEPQPT